MRADALDTGRETHGRLSPFMPDDEQPESAADWTGTGEPEVALSCPSCGTLLDGAELFEVYRVCPGCRRHFWLPARERLHLLVDPGSFVETSAELASIDPLTFRDPLPLARPHRRGARAERHLQRGHHR
ncbi:MAG: hypothetical protein KatS3mg059_0510 [Thermomicrobiales bacterium]|nr:MAG: hypothetical protein KatS3mg059_0510 [Thermomicrobiales bacterium]